MGLLLWLIILPNSVKKHSHNVRGSSIVNVTTGGRYQYWFLDEPLSSLHHSVTALTGKYQIILLGNRNMRVYDFYQGRCKTVALPGVESVSF